MIGIVMVPAGRGMVAEVDQLRARRGVQAERGIQVGDGSHERHVMLHVNRGEGLNITAPPYRE